MSVKFLGHLEVANGSWSTRFITVGTQFFSLLGTSFIDGLRQRAVNVRADTIGSIATAIADAGTGPKTKAERPEIVGYVRECILRQTDEGYAVACEAAAGTVDADQAAITCPVLLITGTADGIAPPEKTQHIAAGFGDATVHVIDGIGHWTVVEAGAEVASLVAEFLG